MYALVSTADAPFGLALGERPEPDPAADQVVVDVSHTSLNFGDVDTARSAAAGGDTVSGWDAAGVVAVAAKDGTGPPVGTRVLTFGYSGAWAQRRTVATNELTEIPAAVDPAVAAALPVAGVTALRALRRSGTLLGRRVVVTGASGGVGRFAVQLAARAGAHVIAVSRRGAGLAERGAHEVVTSLDGISPVDVVLDTVGGSQLVRAWELVRPGGVVQSVGWTSGEPAIFPPYATVGPAKSLSSFQVGTGFGPDMRYLLDLVVDGSLTVDIGWRGSWRKFDEATEALLSRSLAGKAVLDID